MGAGWCIRNVAVICCCHDVLGFVVPGLKHIKFDSAAREWVLDPLVVEFLEFWVDPERSMSKQAWAKEHQVSVDTIKRWQREPVFQRRLQERLAELNVNPDRIQAVVDTLHRNAVGGDVRSAELYLKYVDRLQPATVVVTDRRPSELSDAELVAALEAARFGLGGSDDDSVRRVGSVVASDAGDFRVRRDFGVDRLQLERESGGSTATSDLGGGTDRVSSDAVRAGTDRAGEA